MSEAEARTCPLCGTDSTPGNTTCQCGYTFDGAAGTREVAPAASTPGSGWFALGCVFTLAGAFGLLMALLMKTTVDVPGG